MKTFHLLPFLALALVATPCLGEDQPITSESGPFLTGAFLVETSFRVDSTTNVTVMTCKMAYPEQDDQIEATINSLRSTCSSDADPESASLAGTREYEYEPSYGEVIADREQGVLMMEIRLVRIADNKSSDNMQQSGQSTAERLHSTAGTVSESDLQAIASMSDIQFKRYDYDLPFDHCIHLTLRTVYEDGVVNRAPSGSVCPSAGPQRLLVPWQRTGNGMKFRVSVHSRSEYQPANIDAAWRALHVPEGAVFEEIAVPETSLKVGEDTLLVNIGYFGAKRAGDGEPPDSYYTDVQVLGELAPGNQGSKVVILSSRAPDKKIQLWKTKRP